MHDFITIENPKQMKKQIFATKMMVALLTWLFISISCSKKNDILMVEQPSAEQQKKVVDRFLNAPDNVSKELNYIIDNIRKTEEKTPFLYAFAQRNGFPNWQKITGNIPIYAPEYNKQVHVTDVAINAINSNQISNPNSTATLFIPLQDTVTKEIKAYIYCQKSLDGTVTYKTYNKAAILQTPPSSKEDIKTKGVLLSVFAHFEKSINHKNELQLPAPYNYTFKDVVVGFSSNKTATENSDMVFDEGCKDGHFFISIFQLLTGYDIPCSPVLHFTIICQNGKPMNIPPTIEYPCAKSIEPGGGGSNTPPPSNGGSTPPPPTSTPPPPSSGGGGGWLGVFPTPPPTNTPPSYVDPNLGGGSNTSPSYPNNPSLPPNWEEDPNEPWFPVGRTPVNGIQYSAQLQYLIDNLQLSHEQAEWLSQHPVFTNELYQEFIAYTNINGQSDELISATKALIDIMINGEIDNPFSAQSFSYIAPYLTSDVLAVGDANVFGKYFSNQQWLISFNNPSLQPWLVYWQAIKNTIDAFSLDGADKPNKFRDPAKFDKRVFQPFNFATQQIPVIPNVIPKSDFVKWFDGANCLDLCEKQIDKKNCIMTNGYDPGNQTFALRKNPVKPTLNNSSRSTEQYDENETLKAISYMIDALNKGIPVIAGVDTRDGVKPNENKDNVTNHFIVIVGTSIDSKGRVCFNFYDNGTSNVNEGTKDGLRIVFIPGVGLVAAWSSESNPNYDPNWKVTQVRKCVKD